MLKVGLTGGIGSGKSEVSKFFYKWGAFIFDADKEAKNIIDKNEKAQQEIIREFGSDVINIDNKIDKKKLDRVDFQDEIHKLNLNTKTKSVECFTFYPGRFDNCVYMENDPAIDSARRVDPLRASGSTRLGESKKRPGFM